MSVPYVPVPLREDVYDEEMYLDDYDAGHYHIKISNVVLCPYNDTDI